METKISDFDNAARDCEIIMTCKLDTASRYLTL